MTLRLPAAIALASALLLPGCGEDDLSGPPELRPGRHTCIECGMIINEPRFAAALMYDDDGVKAHHLFDDLGDLFDYERSHTDLRVLDRWVMDHAGGGWVALDEAVVVHCPTLVTPMGTGLVGFARREDADRLLAERPGRAMGAAEARGARAAFVRERYR